MKRSVPVLFLLFAAATAFGSSGLVSPFAPEAAYTAYGGAIERLEQRLPDFYGGSGQSAAYQVTYGTLSAATVFIGTEFGQAGRVAHVGRTASRPQLLLPAGRQPVALLPEYAESLAARGAETLPPKLYHYTRAENVEGILKYGIGRDGYFTWTTPAGNLSPVQAQIELALPPNRGYPSALFEIETARLQQLGINPAVGPQRIMSTPNAAGGGIEYIFNQRIPPSAIKQVPYP